jgi:hypothetical protein
MRPAINRDASWVRALWGHVHGCAAAEGVRVHFLVAPDAVVGGITRRRLSYREAQFHFVRRFQVDVLQRFEDAQGRAFKGAPGLGVQAVRPKTRSMN